MESSSPYVVLQPAAPQSVGEVPVGRAAAFLIVGAVVTLGLFWRRARSNPSSSVVMDPYGRVKATFSSKKEARALARKISGTVWPEEEVSRSALSEYRSRRGRGPGSRNVRQGAVR